MPKDMSSDTTVHITDGQPVMLPSDNVIADAQFTREGSDLLLSTPDGAHVTVEGYFNHTPPPALDTPTGKHLSPDMVSAFLAPAHPAQYADAMHDSTANDVSPVGKVTQVVGKAEIIHPDGTHSPATLNAAIHQGDVIQTADHGGVNILFVDNTTFAISESARMSVDEFTYHPADHSGSTFFSMLQGMFVYTSGLVGKHDVGHVNIDTPVGSIGIRGTVVAGDIHPAGQDSHITIVDGAIVVTNDGGSVQLDHTFGTVTLNDFSAAPADTGQLTAQQFTSTYDGVHSVAGSTFDAVSDGTYHTTPPAPLDTTTPTDNTHGLLLPGDILTDPNVQQAPQTGSTFGHDSTATFADSSTAGHFDTGAAVPADTSTTVPVLSDDTTSTTVASSANPIDTSTTSPLPHMDLSFLSWYNADGGIPLFNLTLGGQAESPTNTLAHVTGPAGTDHFNLVMTSNVLEHTAGTQPITQIATGLTDALTVGTAVGGVADININNPYAMASFVNNGGLNFTLEAYDSQNNLLSSHNYTAAFDNSALYNGAHVLTMVGDYTGVDLNTTPASLNDFLVGNATNDVLFGRAGSDQLTSGGGYDTMIGSSGQDKFVLTSSTYHYIDGRGGADTLKLQGGNVFDVSSTHNIYNIPSITMENTSSNTLTLTLQDVFDMVGASGTLDISSQSGQSPIQQVNLLGAVGTPGFSDTGAATAQRTIVGTYNSSTVTLVIHNSDMGHGAINATVT